MLHGTPALGPHPRPTAPKWRDSAILGTMQLIYSTDARPESELEAKVRGPGLGNGLLDRLDPKLVNLTWGSVLKFPPAVSICR